MEEEEEEVCRRRRDGISHPTERFNNNKKRIKLSSRENMQVFSVKLRLKNFLNIILSNPMLPRLLLLLRPSYEAAKPVFPSSSSSRPNNRAKKGEEHPISPSPLPPSPPLSSPLKRTHERCGWKWRDGRRRRRPNLFVGLGSVCPSSSYSSQKSSLAQALLLRRNEGPPSFPLSLSSLPLPPPRQFMSSLSHSLPRRLLRPRAGRYGIRRNSNN